MTKSSIMINLDDPQSDKIADAISNKTSKKILSLLAENEMSSSEIAEKLGIPLNTATYNLKNLVDSGLVERSKRFFWSSKGKKMELYKVSNKRIIIFPKMMIKGILPAVLITCVIAAMIAFSFQPSGLQTTMSKDYSQDNRLMVTATPQPEKAAESAAAGASATSAFGEESASADLSQQTATKENIYTKLENAPNIWAWYLIGAMTALVVVIFWNWRKN
jgi:DNA-binding transcriptional ArsR family regulator